MISAASKKNEARCPEVTERRNFVGGRCGSAVQRGYVPFYVSRGSFPGRSCKFGFLAVTKKQHRNIQSYHRRGQRSAIHPSTKILGAQNPRPRIERFPHLFFTALTQCRNITARLQTKATPRPPPKTSNSTRPATAPRPSQAMPHLHKHPTATPAPHHHQRAMPLQGSAPASVRRREQHQAYPAAWASREA